MHQTVAIEKIVEIDQRIVDIVVVVEIPRPNRCTVSLWLFAYMQVLRETDEWPTELLCNIKTQDVYGPDLEYVRVARLLTMARCLFV